MCSSDLAAGRAEVSLAPLLVHGHAASHLIELIERLCPEELVKVKITVVALCRAGIGAEEVKRGPVRKHHRIAFQLHLDFFGEVDDVLLKDVGLCLTGGKENLVTSGKQGVNGGFCTCCTGYTERTGGGAGE